LQLYHDLTAVASPVVVITMATALLALSARARDWLSVALSMLGPAAAIVTAEAVVKPLVDRRNAAGALAFPSATAAAAAAVAALALVVIYRRAGSRCARRCAIPVAVLPGLVSVGVVGLRWHSLFDALGGVALGTAVVLGLAAALSLLPIATQRDGS
jgi:hypothetical protein